MWGVGGMVCDRGCCCKGVWVARCVVWGLPLQVLQGGVGGMACGMGLASAGAARGCRDMMCVGLVIQVLQWGCGAASIWETVIFLAFLGNNIPIHLGHLIFPTSSGK
jgi:hypothetical protein